MKFYFVSKILDAHLVDGAPVQTDRKRGFIKVCREQLQRKEMEHGSPKVGGARLIHCCNEEGWELHVQLYVWTQGCFPMGVFTREGFGFSVTSPLHISFEVSKSMIPGRKRMIPTGCFPK